MANIRIYLYLIVLTLMGSVVSSCNNDDAMPHDGTHVKLTLTLGNETSLYTRATDSGVDALNENLINNVDVFFYKKDAANTDEPVYATEMQISADTKSTAQLDISMPIAKYNELFPTDSDTECLVYVIVNRPNSHSGDNALPADKSLGSLKENTILYAENFAKRVEDPVTHLYSPFVQDNFVMDGEAVISRSGSELAGAIPVKRVAAKISLYIDGLAPEVEDNNGVKWMSDINSVRLSLRRGSMRTKLGSTPTEYIYMIDKENDIFSLNAVSLDKTVGESITTSVPFYTYPTNWMNDENSRTHFILIVEWTKKGTAERMTTFYEVNVNAAGSYTKRNHHYVIRQEISVLGSREEETPVILTPSSYLILDWGNSVKTDADLSRFKYLVVDETNIVMDNISNKQIYFFSSDPIELLTATIQWEYIGQENSQTLTFATKENANRSDNPDNGDITYVFSNTASVSGVNNRIRGDYKVTLKIHNANPNVSGDRSYIIIDHPLDNDMDKESDYTEYTITLNVRHRGDSKYNETIKIVQYPMIAIKAEKNSVPTTNGGVWINNSTSSDKTNYGGAHGLTGSNKNPNRYIISVSALNSGSTYIIGDPRDSSVDNVSATNKSAPTMGYSGDTSNRGLKYYHPTLENDLTTDMISPLFMIASSYGVTLDVSKENARKRCATYQEDGYPAGRWRLPTQAEVEYIVSLSAWKVIPTLFGNSSGGTTNYWSANGGVTVNTTNGTVSPATSMSSGPVRCVYDLWYWTDKCLGTQFTWGDKKDF